MTTNETKIKDEQLRAETMKRRMDEVTQKIADVLKQGGHTVEMSTDQYSKRLHIGRVDGEFPHVGVDEQRSGGNYHRPGTGRLYVTVGGYGGKRNFPEPKAGFDYEKICMEIVAQITEWKSQRTEQERQNAARIATVAMAQRVNEACGINRATNDGPWFEVVGVTRPTLMLPHGTTEQQATAILRAAQAVLAGEMDEPHRHPARHPGLL